MMYKISILHSPFSFFLTAFCLIVSCNHNTFYHKTDKLPNDTWSIDNILVYEVHITNPLQYYNFYFDVRNSTDYADQNLWIFFTTKFPDGKVFTDTLNCIISDPYGRWTGKGSGRIKDNMILFKPKVRFPQTGTYIFTAQHAMRINDLKGITDFGIHLQYE